MINDMIFMLGSMLKIMLFGFWTILKYTCVYLWHHPKVLFLTLILLFVVSFQFYRLSSDGTLLGTDSSEMQAVQEILKGYIITPGLTSPGTSFATGPFYYYLITPFVWSAGFKPPGIIIMVEIFTLLTVYLFFFTGNRFFNKEAGLFAATLYAISTVVLTYSRESGIAAIMPFFVLMMFYMQFCAIGNIKPTKYFLLTGYFLGLCIQLNSFALFFIVILLLYTFIGEWLMRDAISIKQTLKNYLLIFAGLLIALLPFLYADFYKNFTNTQQMFAATYGSILPAIQQIAPFFTTLLAGSFKTFMQVVFNLPDQAKLASLPLPLLLFWQFSGLLMILGSIALLAIYRNKFVILLIALWTILGLFFAGVMKDPKMYHLVFFFPIPLLLVGNVLGYIYRLFEQDKWHMEERPVANANTQANGESTYGEETIEVVRVKKTDKKKLALHILFVFCCLTLLFIIAIFNLAKLQ